MKLIIDIPQDELQMYAISCNHGIGNTAMERILNGVPLKQYGTLQEIRQEIEHLYENNQQFDILTIINVLSIIDKYIEEIE